MGDYTKVIVNCNLKNVDNLEEFESKIQEIITIGLDSAYQCSGDVFELVRGDWNTTLVIVTQAKYSRGVEELAKFLLPYVSQGFGENDTYLIAYTEDCINPKQYTIHDKETI